MNNYISSNELIDKLDSFNPINKTIPKEYVFKERILTELKVIGLKEEELKIIENMNLRKLENIKNLLLKGYKFKDII